MKITCFDGKTYNLNIPEGWHVVTDGYVKIGDKLFNTLTKNWVDAVEADQTEFVRNFNLVIRHQKDQINP